MVVPIERVSRAEKSKKYIGNNLNLSLGHNTAGVQVTGNNCIVKISENTSRVKVIGDNYEITVLNGKGDIQYIGNCGKINLGPRVSEDVLSYIGNEGEISNVSEECDDQDKRQKTEECDVKCGNVGGSRRTRIDVCNSNSIRITTSCIPDGIINDCVPIIRISGNRHCCQKK